MNLASSPIGPKLQVIDVMMPAGDDKISRRLMELGFIEGAIVEIRHRAAFFSDPIAVEVRGMIVALRLYEAELVQVKKIDTTLTPTTKISENA